MKRNSSFSLVLFILIIGLVGGFFLGKLYVNKFSGKSSVYSKFENLQDLKELQLTTFHSDKLLTIENEYEKLQMVATVPIEIKGSIEMHKLSFISEGNNRVKVFFPGAKLSKPQIDLNKVKNYDIFTKLNIPNYSKTSYSKTFTGIQKALDSAKNALTQEEKEKFKDKTEMLGKLYIRNFAEAFDCEVYFVKDTIH